MPTQSSSVHPRTAPRRAKSLTGFALLLLVAACGTSDPWEDQRFGSDNDHVGSGKLGSTQQALGASTSTLSTANNAIDSAAGDDSDDKSAAPSKNAGDGSHASLNGQSFQKGKPSTAVAIQGAKKSKTLKKVKPSKVKAIGGGKDHNDGDKNSNVEPIGEQDDAVSTIAHYCKDMQDQEPQLYSNNAGPGNLDSGNDALFASNNGPLSSFESDCGDNLQCFFVREVWETVVSTRCVQCHQAGGLASNFTYTLLDSIDPIAVHSNLQTYTYYDDPPTGVPFDRNDESTWPRILTKPLNENASGTSYSWDFNSSTGNLSIIDSLGEVAWYVPEDDYHMGGTALTRGTPEFEAFLDLIERLQADESFQEAFTPYAIDQELATQSDQDSLRRAALILVGRFPTAAENDELAQNGFDSALSLLLTDPEFYETLRRWYADQFLTDALLALRSNQPESLYRLNDEDFPNRYWYTTAAADVKALFTNLTGTDDNSVMMRAGRAVAREALELIVYVVKNHGNNSIDFRSILTANHTVVNPYSAPSYNLVDVTSASAFISDLQSLGFNLSEACLNLEAGGCDDLDPKDFQPASVTAKGGEDSGATEDRAIPHAGVLTTPIFMYRQPTDSGNKNRHRANNFSDWFMGKNLFEYFEPALDFDAGSTTENSACTSCHHVHDRLGGAYRNWDSAGRYRPGYASNSEGGWYTSVFRTGFNWQTLPTDQAPNALQWLTTELTSETQPRFARATAYTIYEQLLGQSRVDVPRDASSSTYGTQFASYSAEQRFLEEAAVDFSQHYNLKTLIARIIASHHFRAGEAVSELSEESEDTLINVGATYLLGPEQLDRRIEDRLGMPWLNTSGKRKLLNDYRTLYGGIDSKSVVHRVREPNSIMSSIITQMASEMSCRVTAQDLSKAPADRVLLPTATIPSDGSMPSDAELRDNVSHLFSHLLGETQGPNSSEADYAMVLFVQVYNDLSQLGDSTLHSHCRSGSIQSDDSYVVRAWMAVIQYLLQDYRFVYVD